jgi:hypothetical protein
MIINSSVTIIFNSTRQRYYFHRRKKQLGRSSLKDPLFIHSSQTALQSRNFHREIPGFVFLNSAAPPSV